MRITNSTTYGNTYTVADVLNDLTKAAFAADLKGSVNVYRQNLQTEIVKALANTIGVSPMYDNVSKAAALSTLKKIKGLLATAVSPDEQTRAHRNNLNFLIDKATAIK